MVANQKPRVRIAPAKVELPPVVIQPEVAVAGMAPEKELSDNKSPHRELWLHAQELAAQHQLHPQLCFDLIRRGETLEQWMKSRKLVAAEKRAKWRQRAKAVRARKQKNYLERSPFEINWLKTLRESQQTIFLHLVDQVQVAVIHGFRAYRLVTRATAETPPRDSQQWDKLSCCAITTAIQSKAFVGIDHELRDQGLKPAKDIALRPPFPNEALERAMASSSIIKVTLYDGSQWQGLVDWTERYAFLLRFEGEDIFIFKHAVLLLTV